MVRAGMCPRFASKAAGVMVMVHTCRRLWLDDVASDEQAVLDKLPVTTTWHGTTMEAIGLTAELVRGTLLVLV